MRFHHVAPFLWLIPGLALLLIWRITYAPPGLAWWCMLLWLPVFLTGVVKAGLSLQSYRAADGKPALSITYREVFQLRPWALLALLAGALTSAAAVLLFMYPERPTTLAGWMPLVFPWPILWLVWPRLRSLFSGRPQGQE